MYSWCRPISGQVTCRSLASASSGNHPATRSRHCAALTAGPPGARPSAGARYLRTVLRSSLRLSALSLLPLPAYSAIIKDRTVAGMKVDVEGFEIEVLRGCERALSEHRIRLIQLEWNMASLGAVGTDRIPVADQLARYGYALYPPHSDGVLVPMGDLGFGADVFARPRG